jgi:hypothetical protein
MPYFNSLAKKYAVAAQYYANMHLMLVVAGQNVTLWDGTTSCYNVDNVVRHLLLHGMTWKRYQERLALRRLHRTQLGRLSSVPQPAH